MKTVFQFVERMAPDFLRISLGLVLLWIGALHLHNPHSTVVLLSPSLPGMAASAFVSVLGALEVLAGVLLIAGLWVRYVCLLTLVLFAGTLTSFVIAPAVTGFPIITLLGQFLLKDEVLASAAITVAAMLLTRACNARFATQERKDGCRYGYAGVCSSGPITV